VCAHFTPRVGSVEPARFPIFPFQLPETPGRACLSFGSFEFLGMHTGFGDPLIRRVRVLSDGILVEDYCALSLDPFDIAVPFSPGYGLLSSPVGDRDQSV
jgi:hypothetical protein